MVCDSSTTIHGYSACCARYCIGGGDSFASGLIDGFLTENDPQEAVDYGCVHGALAMTTPGDTTMASLNARPNQNSKLQTPNY
jgi:fructose-1-phosphate kinase PfkB-like protein